MTTGGFLARGWNAYIKHVQSVVMPRDAGDVKDISFWRNRTFCNILTYIAPVSIIALVPSIYMAFKGGLVVVGTSDILAFVLVLVIMLEPHISLRMRKFIFIFIIYTLAVVLLYYVGKPGSGLLFLLALTILTSIIHSPPSSYYSAWANTLICVVFGLLIYLKINIPIVSGYTLGIWIAVSSNLVLLSFVCAECLNLLLKGLETTTDDKLLTEREFKKTYDRLMFHIENSSLGFIEWDEQLHVKSWSKRAEEIFGWTEQEYKDSGMTALSQVYQEDLPRIIRIGQELVNGEVRQNKAQHRNYTKDGRVIWCEWYNSVLKDDAGKVISIMSLVQDITGRKEAAQQREFDRNNLHSLINNTSDVMWSVDKELKLVTSNQAFDDMVRSMSGHSPVMGSTVLSDGFDDRELKRFKSCYDRALSGEAFTEIEHNTFPVELWSEISYNPIRKDGVVVGTACFSRDITQRKESEKEIVKLNTELEEKVEKRTAQLEAANKELDSFSYSVSHDLRAPLRIIDGYGQILVEDYASNLDAGGRETLDVIMKNAQKMGQLIDDLLHFSKLGSTEPATSSVDMNQLVSEVVDELRASGMAVPTHLEIENLAPARADVRLLKQVWINLISNAIKYSGKVDQPVIQIGMNVLPHKTEYFVRDNGVGFDMKYYNKLFGVFQRLHGDQEFAGTGVGLALVQRIIARHGGTVWAESKPDEGATFYFSLPELHVPAERNDGALSREVGELIAE